MNLEFLNWIQIAVLICLAILGLGRALILKTQKIMAKADVDAGDPMDGLAKKRKDVLA